MDGAPHVHISRVHISGYRSCRDTSLVLNPQLSALIGINGSGKTNLLSAVYLIRKLANASRLFAHRRSEADSTLNPCKLSIDFNVAGKIIKYKAAIRYNTDERNQEDIVSAEEEWKLQEYGDQWLPFPMQLVKSGPGKINTERMFEYLIFQRMGQGKRPPLEKIEELQNMSSQALPSLEPIGNFISRITYYSASRYTNPSECPAYFSLEEDEQVHEYSAIPSRGSHARFIYDLYKLKEKNSEGFEEFESIIGRKGLGLVDKIQFHPFRVPTNKIEVRTGGKIVKKKIRRVIVVPHFVINNTKLSPGQLSEGTFKTLAILLYLSTDASELLLLEEPEVCIHHGLLSSLMELLKSYSKHKQIVITTHSDLVLDMLAAENVFLVKNIRSKGTVVSRLPETMSRKNFTALKQYLAHSGSLGEYWRDSGFE